MRRHDLGAQLAAFERVGGDDDLALPAVAVLEIGHLVAGLGEGGKSELLRVGCPLTAGRGDPTESATETYRPDESG